MYDQEPAEKQVLKEKAKPVPVVKPVTNTHFVHDDIMYSIRMQQWKDRQAMLEEKRKNRKPSLCGMIVVIIVRNLMCFFMFLIVIATIYMFYTLEDNKPSDFNFELSDNYVKA